MRNILLVAASRAMGVDMRKLARAFGISPAMGRNIRRRYRQQGLPAIVEHKRGGRERKLTAKLQTRLNKLFEKGLMIDEAHEKIRRSVSRTLVGRAHKRWVDAKEAADNVQLQCVTSPGRSAPAQEAQPPNAGASSDDAAQVVVARERRAPKHSVVVTGPIAQRESPEKERDDDASREPSRLLPLITEGEPSVQHLGCWVMLAMLNALGIYAYAEVLRQKTQTELVVEGKRVMPAETLRLAIDAVAIALTLRQKAVEGVRRIATTSSMILLRLRRAGPLSASWVRRILGSFAARNSNLFRMALATTLVQQSERHAAESMRVVFYIDNHMRPYTGKFKIRKGCALGQIGQDGHLLVAIASRSIEAQNNASNFELFAVTVRDDTQLFVDFPSFCSSTLLERFGGLERQVGVLSDHEKRVPCGNTKQQHGGTEVTVGDPNIAFLHKLEDLRRQ